MSMIPLIIVAVGVLGTAIALIVIGIRNPQTADERTWAERLDELTKSGEQVNLEKIELSQPFKDRIVFPLARSLGELAIRFTPQNALQSLNRQLELAGSPARLDPTIFLAIQLIIALIFGAIVFAVFRIGTLQWPFGRIFLVGVIFAVLGFFFPRLWLTSRIQRRQNNIRKSLPDALDLLTICVEAGLGFDAAMHKVSEKWDNELSLAFARVIQEIQLGKLRRDALRDMADRVGISEMTSFVAAVIQSEVLGVSMSKILRIQADQMRIRRRQRAEEEAHKAPIKMIIPMGLLIFPALMVTLLSPAAMRLMQSALGGMLTK